MSTKDLAFGLFSLAAIAVLIPASANAQSNPWIHTYPTPLREFYIGPNSTSGYAQDFSTNNNDGTILGTYSPGTTGKLGNAYQFDGTDDYIQFANPISIWDSNFSYTFWMKIPTQITRVGIIGQSGSASSGGHGQHVYVDLAGKLVYNVGTNENITGCPSVNLNINGPVVTDNNWHHVVVTKNGNTATMYVDNVVVGTMDVSTATSTCGPDAPLTKLLNVRQSPTSLYKGQLDELAIIGRALSASDVSNLYNGGQGRQVTEPVIVGYHFDEPLDFGTQSNPITFKSASENALPGDLFWVLPGTYNAGQVNISRDGTNANPIVYRALTGTTPKIIGAFQVSGDNNWVWGLEITDPENVAPTTGVNVQGERSRVINNIIHTHCDDNGLGGWNVPGQVFYGNIVYGNGCNPTLVDDGSRLRHPHNIYTQNNYDTNGYHYFVNNIIFEPGCTNSCFSFHAYTEGGFLSGFHFQNNIMNGGRWLIGGFNVPHHHNKVIGNYFNNNVFQIGYRRPTQTEISNNYINNSEFRSEYFWGAGEVTYTKELPNVVQNNEFVTSTTNTVLNLRTSAYLSTGRFEGTPQLDPRDIVDNNKYYGNFKATLFANNVNARDLSFSAWKTASTTAGKSFDVNSQQLALPTTPKVAVLPNEYEPGRAHVAVYNWGNLSNVSLNLSNVLNSGDTYKIYKAKETSSSPIAQGTYNGGNVSVPTNGAADMQLLVLANTSSQPTPPPTTTPTVQPTPSPTPVPVPGDANGDRVVDGKDYVRWVNFYQRQTAAGATEGDFNNDGTVDGRDYVVWVNNYTSATTTPTGITLEAENAALVFPMSSSGTYVSTSTDNQGSATFTVNISESGTYTIWAKHLSPDSSTDSFFVSVDGGEEDIFDTAEGKWSSNWQWTQVNGRGTSGTPLAVNPRTFNLTEGTHTITFGGRDAETQLDQIVVQKQ